MEGEADRLLTGQASFLFPTLMQNFISTGRRLRSSSAHMSDDANHQLSGGSNDSMHHWTQDEMEGLGNSHDLGWTRRLTKPLVHEFCQESGPQHKLPLDASPLDYFFLLWPESLFETIVRETNLYAKQRIAASGKADPLWFPTRKNEMMAFFALAIMMGIKSVPRLYCYWTRNQALRCEWISGTMSRARYAKINQYLQLRDNSCQPLRNHPDYDPIYKVRDMINVVKQNFSRWYYPRRELSVDEGMIPFKGRLFFKQHMPRKPVKWGIKVWELCEAETGFCLNFDIYTGRNRQARPTKGLGYQVVMHLLQGYQNKNHHVYFDRFFSTPELLEDLLYQHGTYACSTVSLNRRGIPPSVKELNLQCRGDVAYFQNGCLMLTMWRDRRIVAILSTSQVGRMEQMPDGKLKPQAVIRYTQYMGGVDRSDQYRSYYSVGRSSKKWWRYIVWFLMNLAIVNAWLLFRESKHAPPPTKNYDHLRFRLDLAEQLRAGFSGHCLNREIKYFEIKYYLFHHSFLVSVIKVTLTPIKLIMSCRHC
uniref:PiggyBac transposable element-derived protein domain-containing protein n=1 Tax=Eptatretus burgeri TaxID=7764 RepID=A0A8C4Q8A5_EPTBU